MRESFYHALVRIHGGIAVMWAHKGVSTKGSVWVVSKTSLLRGSHEYG